MQINPYLFYDGTCRAAFTRYGEIFGVAPTIMGFGDAPMDVPEGFAERVLHASLVVEGAVLFGSDAGPGVEAHVPKGFCVSITLTDEDEATRIFAALAEGGHVDLPLAPTFFAKQFGQCTDRWGVPWMVDASAPHG